MDLDFKEIMSKHTDEELIKIVTVDRNKYQNIAIEAAESEILHRGITSSFFDKTKTEFTNIREERNQLESKKVGSLIRLFHFIFDTAIWTLLVFILTLPLNAQDEAHITTGYVVLFITFIGYYYFMEAKYQKTFAKFITRTKVVSIEGDKPTSSDIFRRTLCRLIPFDRVSFLFSPNGFHDRLSDTMIIKDESWSKNTDHNIQFDTSATDE